jgi:hypothetical protein
MTNAAAARLRTGGVASTADFTSISMNQVHVQRSELTKPFARILDNAGEQVLASCVHVASDKVEKSPDVGEGFHDLAVDLSECSIRAGMSEEPELIMPCESVQCLQTCATRLPRPGKQQQGDCLTRIKIVDDDPHLL